MGSAHMFCFFSAHVEQFEQGAGPSTVFGHWTFGGTKVIIYFVPVDVQKSASGPARANVEQYV